MDVPASGAVLTNFPVISIVDDDESVREATKSLVRSLGYVAMSFASAEEFLKSDTLAETSCLVADIQMPGMNGIELQAKLRESGYSTPTIFITAFPEDRTRQHALRSGAIGFLSKPFQDSDLIACMDRALGAGTSKSNSRI
jgi:FixJ family two-component response regulator